MNQRTRKLVGAIGLLVFLVAYALVAMAVAAVLQVNSGPYTELIYYLIAGTLWALPAAWVISWMGRPDAATRRQG